LAGVTSLLYKDCRRE